MKFPFKAYIQGLHCAKEHLTVQGHGQGQRVLNTHQGGSLFYNRYWLEEARGPASCKGSLSELNNSDVVV